MLPPRLRSGLVSASRHSTSTMFNSARWSAGPFYGQSRSFWGWRRGCDWSSQLDSSYQRSQHVRAIKTRAKLRAILRRKGKFEWDVLQRPFFTSKHVRWASHWNGPGGKPQWPHQVYDENDENKRAEVQTSEEQGYELSRREKKWRDLTESMRKHIDRDPYEAVFGKRFEPFWNPLVPNWMKEALVEGESKDSDQRSQSAKPEVASKPVKADDVTVKTTVDKTAKPGLLQSDSSRSAALNIDDRPRSYAYSSSTTWDSWSDRTKQTEWDSVSNKTRQYEYDPISNRMVQVSNTAVDAEQVGSERNKPTPVLISVTDLSSVPTATSNEKGVQVISPKRTALKALESLPKNDLDLLTADGVRASMGKVRDTSPQFKHERADLEADFKVRAQAKDHEVNEVLLSHQLAKSRGEAQSLQTSLGRSHGNVKIPTSTPLQSAVERLQAKKGLRSIEDADDSAAHESTESVTDLRAANIPTNWSRQTELLQADRVKRNAAKNPFPMLPRWIDDMNARKAAYEAQQVPSVDEQAEIVKKQRLEAMLVKEVEQQKLRFSMHETRRAHKTSAQELEKELDRFDRVRSQADAAVEQSVASLSSNTFQAGKTLNRCDGPVEGARASQGLEAELVTQQAEAKKSNERYKEKVRTLQAELDMAYKQSSQHSEMHIDHIRQLEKELKRFEGSASDRAPSGSLVAELTDQKSKLEQRYKQKLQLLQTELETAYKQSSKHSEMHMDQIRKLEEKLEKLNKATRSADKVAGRGSLEYMRGEGDFCTNVVKFANSEKWYKRPASSPQQQQEGQKLEKKECDQRLVREVRAIYERAYGTIDAQHRQDALQRSLSTKSFDKQDREGHGVTEALSSYEHNKSYAFKRDNLASELNTTKVAEKEMPSQKYQFKVDGLADELTQKKGPLESSSLLYRFKADGLANEIARQEQEAYEAIAANEQNVLSLKNRTPSTDVQPPIKSSEPFTEMSTIVWQDPATYKILAYDTANDTFSTTSTTSNFTLSEQPISLPQALAQLNQPARFMPHFAELQQDGFQVIYASRDLLLFRQVKTVPNPKTEYVTQRTEHLNIHDHGLLRPYENTLAQEAAMFHDSVKAAAPVSEDPSSVEHGHNFGLTPPENMMAQEAAHAHDLARQSVVKPVDGKVRSHGVKPATGNFASPTDFVNHDPVTLHSERTTPLTDGEVIQYPRVKRQEPVFSATLPPPPVPTFGRASDVASYTAQSKAPKRERRRQLREEQLQWRRERQRRRRSGAGAVKWALSVGIFAAGTAYAIGTIAEKTRSRGAENGQSKERWQEILEGKRGRWE